MLNKVKAISDTKVFQILFIEDDPVDVDLTKRAFQAQLVENTVLVARDGEEALEHLQRWESGETPPRLILLDLKLPKVDGIEVLRQIKSHPRFKIIPVIVITTSKEISDLKACYQLGVNAYIVKPVDFDDYKDMVKRIHLFWILTNIYAVTD